MDVAPGITANIPSDFTKPSSRYKSRAWIALVGLIGFITIYLLDTERVVVATSQTPDSADEASSASNASLGRAPAPSVVPLDYPRLMPGDEISNVKPDWKTRLFGDGAPLPLLMRLGVAAAIIGFAIYTAGGAGHTSVTVYKTVLSGLSSESPRQGWNRAGRLQIPRNWALGVAIEIPETLSSRPYRSRPGPQEAIEASRAKYHDQRSRCHPQACPSASGTAARAPQIPQMCRRALPDAGGNPDRPASRFLFR
jgi:hypothetical protein